jgi:hypothetical protein
MSYPNGRIRFSDCAFTGTLGKLSPVVVISVNSCAVGKPDTWFLREFYFSDLRVNQELGSVIITSGATLDNSRGVGVIDYDRPGRVHDLVVRRHLEQVWIRLRSADIHQPLNSFPTPFLALLHEDRQAQRS